MGQAAMGVKRMNNRAHRIGLVFFVLHTLLFVFTLLAIAVSNDPQVSLIWVLFAIADFPVSLLYLVKPYFFSQTDLDICCVASYITYLPYLLHGVFGAVWWYLLPRLLMPKRLGGIWGSEQSKGPGSNNFPAKP